MQRETDLNKLQRLQNWAAKFILCAKKQDHATPFLKELHWLPIKDRIHFKILLFVFKCLSNIGASYLASMLSLYTSAHIGLRSLKGSTRFQEHKMYPRTLISAADRSFYFTAPKLLNIPRGGTHIFGRTGMCRSNGSLFYKKSLNMGPIFYQKILKHGSRFLPKNP